MTRNFWRGVKQWARMLREIGLPGAIILSLVVVIRLSGLLQVQEWMAFDSLSHFCPSSHEMSSIVIVGIDEDDLRLVGGYPLPDRDLAAALTILQSHQPSVIGLDLFRDVAIEPGHAALVQAFQTMPNLVGTEVALNSEPSLNVKPPPDLPPERIGFADVIVDADGKLRRSILASPTWEGDVKYSLALRLAQIHLAAYGVPFMHGDRASSPLQFGKTTLPRFQPNSGGYIRADANGNQLVLNFCGSQETVRSLSLRDVLQKKFADDWVRDQVVIIGMTASSIKDIFFTSALQETLNSRTSKIPMPANQLIYGVEAHAHTVHQIIDAALKGKPLTQSGAEGLEYLWIITWGVVGVVLGIVLQSPWKTLLSLAIASLILTFICHMLLLTMGWWLPIVPTLLTLCGAGLVTSFFDRDLRFELEQRRLTIERTYEAVHNGPLQYLAVILRSLGEEDLSSEQLGQQLRSLNEELRRIFEHMRQDAATRYAQLYLRGDLVLDLRSPVSELLYQVYNHTRAEQLPGFNTILTFIPPNFEHLRSRHYSLEQKRGLCLFLHEALFNVGKHADGATRLDVICTVEASWYVLRVIDNGPRIDPSLLHEGQGTLQARAIAHDLRGRFDRRPNHPQGTICELSWQMRRNWRRGLRDIITRNRIQ